MQAWYYVYVENRKHDVGRMGGDELLQASIYFLRRYCKY